MRFHLVAGSWAVRRGVAGVLGAVAGDCANTAAGSMAEMISAAQWFSEREEIRMANFA